MRDPGKCVSIGSSWFKFEQLLRSDFEENVIPLLMASCVV
jgi:hypothetical protein